MPQIPIIRILLFVVALAAGLAVGGVQPGSIPGAAPAIAAVEPPAAAVAAGVTAAGGAVSAAVTETVMDDVLGNGDPHPNIILIDLDRLTARRMPCYGYHRNTTPHLCRFAEENLLFTNATAQGTWTAQSVASIFTGQYSSVHRLTNHTQRLAADRLTVAEILDRYGYTAEAFPVNVGNGDPAFLDYRYNLDQGFDHYGNGSRFVAEHVATLRNRSGYRIKDPFFMFVQGFDPHGYDWWGHPQGRNDSGAMMGNYSGILNDPDRWTDWHKPGVSPADIVRRNGTYYLPIPNASDIRLTDAELRYIQNRYDQSLREVDRAVADLFDLLREKGVYEDSIIIVTANHGEVLDTKGMGDGKRFGHGVIYEPNIHVPLIVRLPDGTSGTIDRQVELIDILPTVLHEAGLTPSDSLETRMQGDPLAPLYTGRGTYDDRFGFTEHYGLSNIAARNGTWKLVRAIDSGTELYNLRKDPLEKSDIADSHPNITDTLLSAIKRQQLRNQVLRGELY